jgi:hypothetical protein
MSSATASPGVTSVSTVPELSHTAVGVSGPTTTTDTAPSSPPEAAHASGSVVRFGSASGAADRTVSSTRPASRSAEGA